MKIKVIFPTRSRPDRFLEVLAMYLDSCDDKSKVSYLITVDVDDDSMSDSVIAKAKALHKSVEVVQGFSKSKIDACNRDMAVSGDWDICLLASDDMLPVVQGWDSVLIAEMKKHYPDTDGCLWHYDGHQFRICTMNIMGRKYFERFGYQYHPSYISLWCDNEFTDVATQLGKVNVFDTCLFRHVHPMWEGKKDEMDALYIQNESYFKRDQNNYNNRKANGFPI
jgi:hypothetical protein